MKHPRPQILVAALLVTASPLTAQLSWTQTRMLSARSDHAMAGDLARDRVVLFGGTSAQIFGIPQTFGDTWTWDGTTWEVQDVATAPAARTGARAAYDPVRGRVVLFGGRIGSVPFDDTWEWDGASWTLRTPANRPPSRYEHGIAWHGPSQQLVLFGGMGPAGPLGDTWTFDGTDWTRLNPANSPSPRSGVSLGAHDATGTLVLVGARQSGPDVETWTFDGANWTLRAPAQALPALHSATLAWHPIRQRTVLAGGSHRDPFNGLLGNAFEWDGGSWTPVPAMPGPTGRLWPGLAFRPSDGGLVLCGGLSQSLLPVAPDTWVFNLSGWQVRSGMAQPTLTQGRFVTDATGRPLFVGAGATSFEIWRFDGRRWDEVMPANDRPRKRQYFGAAFDEERNRLVVFGGHDNVLLDDLIEFDFATRTWSTSQPAVRPPELYEYAMAYDPLRGRTVMFGGMTYLPGGRLDETWEWDGANWTRMSSIARPSARVGAAMVFDPDRGVIVLFGGRDNSLNFLSDTWQWDGVQWQVLTPATNPPARAYHGLVFDSARRRVVLHGGSLSPSVMLDDVWDWDGRDWQRRAVTGPAARTRHAIGWDGVSERVVLAGGYTGPGYASDFWQLVTDYPATYRSFGAGCNGSSGVPHLAATPQGDRPYIGHPFTVSVSGLPSSGAVVLAFGVSDASWSGGALPFDFGPFGAVGCTLYSSTEAVLALSNAGGTANWQIMVPNQTSMLDARFFQQAIALDPGANALGLILSNARAARVGGR